MAYSRRLTCCYRGDECLYLHPDYIDCTTLKGESVHSAKGTRTLLDVRVSMVRLPSIGRAAAGQTGFTCMRLTAARWQISA